MKANFNYGLAYLRVFLCFMVVYLHFGKDMSEPLHFVGMCAVPCFVMMSFFFAEYKVLSGNLLSQFKRLGRFAYPLVVWGMLSVVLCLALGDKLTVRAVLEQLFLGMPHQNFILANHNFLAFPLWFEGSMIYTSFLFMLASYCFRANASAIGPVWWLVSALLLALVLQYASFIPWGELLFRYHYVLLTLFFCIPYASLGLLLSRYQVLEYLASFRCRAMLLSAAGAVALAIWHAKQPCYMFYYGGLRLMIESVLIFIIFYLNPLKLGGTLGKVLMLLSKYSMGIYCVHWLVGSRLLEFVPGLEEHWQGWEICVLVYILSLVLAAAIGSLKSPYARALVR